jgi:hypothetical protein
MKWFTERRVVWIMAIALAVLSLVPAVTGYLVGAQKHQAWTGMNFYGFEDAQVYLSYIDQIKHGHWFITNDFTSEPSYPYLSPVWLVIGLMARLGGLEPLVALILGRFLSVLLLTWAAHWSLRQFLRSRWERLASLGLFLFGSGMGCLINRVGRDSMVMPIDQWVSEAFVIRSSLYTPHFVVAWALFVVVLALMFRAFRDGRLRDAVLAGVGCCTLILFHPYHAPSIFFVSGLALVTMSLADLKMFWRRVRALAILVALTVPAIAYHWWLLQPQRNGPHALSGNVCWTPALLYVLLGFGAFVPLAIVGIRLWHRRQIVEERLGGIFLVTWLAGQAAMIYAPTMLQRRFTQGLLFPLAVFSGLAMVAAWQWVQRQPKDTRTQYRLGLIVVTLVAFFLTPMVAFHDDVRLLKNNFMGVVYVTNDETAMFTWMRQNLPEQSVVLSTYWTGDLLPAWTASRAYFGHWGQTIDLRRKEAEVQSFYNQKIDEASSGDFLGREQITYVYYGRRERVEGISLEGLPFLEVAHREGDEILYRVRLER